MTVDLPTGPKEGLIGGHQNMDRLIFRENDHEKPR